MADLSDVLAQAQERARSFNLPYAGALPPADAWQVLQEAEQACLVDVRTSAECDWVGRVPGAIEIEWNQYPAGIRNPDFLSELSRQVDRDAIILFLCRSGARSDGAARLASEAGFTRCYNILEGFEGDKDEHSHRGRINGWKFAGLPWEQL